MTTFYRFFFRSIPWPVQAIGWGALAIWLVKAAFLNRVVAPQPIPDLGGVVEGVLSALISGYVFYVMFVLWPEYKSKAVMAPFICRQISLIYGCYANISRIISDNSGIELDLFNLNNDIVMSAFSKIPLQSCPVTYSYVPGQMITNWFQFFDYRQKQSEKYVNEMLRHGRFLNEEVTMLIIQVLHNRFFFGTEGVSQMMVNNPDLAAWAPGFMQYATVCRDLARWHDSQRPPGVAKLLKT